MDLKEPGDRRLLVRLLELLGVSGILAVFSESSSGVIHLRLGKITHAFLCGDKGAVEGEEAVMRMEGEEKGGKAVVIELVSAQEEASQGMSFMDAVDLESRSRMVFDPLFMAAMLLSSRLIAAKRYGGLEELLGELRSLTELQGSPPIYARIECGDTVAKLVAAEGLLVAVVAEKPERHLYGMKALHFLRRCGDEVRALLYEVSWENLSMIPKPSCTRLEECMDRGVRRMLDYMGLEADIRVWLEKDTIHLDIHVKAPLIALEKEVQEMIKRVVKEFAEESSYLLGLRRLSVDVAIHG